AVSVVHALSRNSEAVASLYFFFFSSRRRHTRWPRDWSSDVCSSDLILPAALVQTLANGIGAVLVLRDAVTLIAVTCRRRSQHSADDFPGGVENQSVPEIPGNGFVALAAFADDGRLHLLGNPVRTFMEKDLERL